MHYYYAIKIIGYDVCSKEENVFHYVSAHAHLCALMTRKLCAVGMHNATLRNHLKLFFCHFNAFVLSFKQNLVIVFLKCVPKK